MNIIHKHNKSESNQIQAVNVFLVDFIAIGIQIFVFKINFLFLNSQKIVSRVYH